MGGHQIRYQKLLFPSVFVQRIVLLLEPLIDLDMGLAHIVQHRIDAVLRRHLQLAGHMVLYQLPKEGVPFVTEHIVIADAGADEDLFDTRNLSQLPQQRHIIGLIRIQVGTGLGRQTHPFGTDSLLQLLLTAWVAQVGRRAAYIVDVALKSRVMGQRCDLSDNALVTAAGHHPPLMKGQGTEITAADAPTVMSDRKTHLLNGRHAAHGIVHRVRFSHIGQLCDAIQLLGGQGHLGRVGHQPPVPVLLQDGLAPHRVVLLVLHLVGSGVSHLVRLHFFIRGHLHPGIHTGFPLPCGEAGASDGGDVTDRHTGVELCGNLQRGRLPHAVNEQIRSGVKQDRSAHLAAPVVIVSKSPQRGFQTTNDEGYVRKGFPHPIGIDDHRPIWPQANLMTGGIGILAAALFCCGVMGYHGV